MADRTIRTRGGRYVADERLGDKMIPNKQIYDSIQEVVIACETICHEYRCEECPLCDSGCIEDCSFRTTAVMLTADKVRKMIEFADKLTDEQEEASKSEEEKKWEAEADYWNDRRCD